MAKKTVGPGSKVPDSGIYKGTKSGTRATMVKGEKWTQVVDTNPKKR